MDASFVTKLPAHEIGQAGVNALRQYGVDTSDIVRGGDRVGIYFLEKGASQRPSKVIYDRAGSAIATATTADFNWDEIFEGADWFHFTGITPALGDNVAEICLEACKAAKAKGINAIGPCPADSVFNIGKSGKFDAILSLYHDQGHIACKTLDFEKSVTLTFGLPFIRSSVDHGTAFDIAGKGIAGCVSLIEST